MDLTSLREAGLTDGEIKVYLALLELGSSTTGPIVDKSGIARSIIYQILEKLMQKGIVSVITKEQTKYFQAAEPSKLLDYIDERASTLQHNRHVVEKLLPQLSLLKASAPESDVQLFTGFRGTVVVHERTYQKLKYGESYWAMGIPAYQPGPHHAYWQRDHQRRAKAGISCRLLFEADTEPEILRNRNSYQRCEARYMPADFKTPAWFLGYADVTAISIPAEKPISVEITNQKIADSFKSYFDDFWKKSKPFEG